MKIQYLGFIPGIIFLALILAVGATKEYGRKPDVVDFIISVFIVVFIILVGLGFVWGVSAL